MQEKDGIVYQSTPNPADNTYTAFNAAAYKTGVKHPNSGHLRVTVSPKETKVDYIRALLQKDENAERKNGTIAHGYTVCPEGEGADSEVGARRRRVGISPARRDEAVRSVV
jgi:hypothetical protein